MVIFFYRVTKISLSKICETGEQGKFRLDFVLNALSKRVNTSSVDIYQLALMNSHSRNQALLVSIECFCHFDKVG